MSTQIRPATQNDLQEIVSLLRESLGDTSSQKSIDYWNWKHIDNPFGASPVLLMEAEGGKIVGVRAFMRWEWRSENRSYAALRAVDTATHPGYRGLGIFKRLTLELLERRKKAGDDFIFNTPNDQSRPGYLKMGWSTIGRVRVRIRPVRPLQMLANKLSGKKIVGKKQSVSDYSSYPVSAALDEFFAKQRGNNYPGPEGKISTPTTEAYLRWRYQYCPVQEYGGIFRGGCLLIFYVREQSIGRELRLVQLSQTEHISTTEARKAIMEVAQKYRVDFISAAPQSTSTLDTLLNHSLFLPALGIGPVLTCRYLRELSEDIGAVERWHYQLGDFELF